MGPKSRCDPFVLARRGAVPDAALFGMAHASAAEARIRFAGVPSELKLSEVSPRTVRLELSPLDETANCAQSSRHGPRAAPCGRRNCASVNSTAKKELRVGQLRLTIKPQPLTVSIRRGDGKLVQELTFDDRAATNAGVSFQMGAPVLGLGEGASQFDRRGVFIRCSTDSERRSWPRMAGPSRSVPHRHRGLGALHPPAWGEFDLRDRRGRFLPLTASQGKEPLELFVISVNEPADALAEYLRLTGKPVMPPKWVMGYMQSHRTLAGPEEPLQIGKTFREKDFRATR